MRNSNTEIINRLKQDNGVFNQLTLEQLNNREFLIELAVNLSEEERSTLPIADKLERIYDQYFREDITRAEALQYLREHPINEEQEQWEINTIFQKFSTDKEFMLEAIDITGKAHSLYFLSEELKDDKEIFLKSIPYNPFNLYYASDKLKKDKELVMLVLAHDKRMTIRDLEDYYKNFSNDKDIMESVYNNFLNDPGVSSKERAEGIIRFHIPVHKEEKNKNNQYIYYSIFGDKAYLAGNLLFEMDGKKPTHLSENIKNGRKSDLNLKTTKVLKRVKEVIITEPLQPDNMNEWFYGMEKLKTIQGLELLDTSKVDSMDELFHGCKSLEELELSFNTDNVESLWAFTAECENLKSLILNFTNTSKLQNIGGLCYGCKKLEELKLNNFDIRNVNYTLEMFDECPKLNPENKTNKELLHHILDSSN